MDKTDNQAFKTLMIGMGEVFDKELSPALMEIYWQALKPYPITKVKAAVNEIIQHRTFSKFPLPGEITEQIAPRVEIEEKALLQAEKVMDKIEESGAYYSVTFDDPITTSVIVQMGGWIRVCSESTTMAKKDQTAFWRKDFIKLYCAIARQGKELRPTEKLIGIFERDNMALGYEVPAETKQLGVIPKPQIESPKEKEKDGTQKD